MAEKISRILVVLANPYIETDQRNNLVNNLCKTFAETCQEAGIEVDLLDLYKDVEFDPVRDIDNRSTKIIEYQIRIKKAQIIVFFHQVWWLSVPAILKGFIDKVFVSGFAFKTYNDLVEGLLDNKKAIVVAVSEKPAWQINYIYGNVLANFWKKGVLDYCGIKDNKLYLFGSFRSVSEEIIQKWHEKMQDIANKINSTQSFLELF
jgi:NAD(P)H dehydrogenase (quinone)